MAIKQKQKDIKVKLNYYSLTKTFEGAITMVKDSGGEYDLAKVKKPVKMTETLSPLEQVIQKINEQFAGNFTDGDKVMIVALHEKLKNNKKLQKSAKTDGQQIFENSIFPQLFDDAAQETYMESTETYTKLVKMQVSIGQLCQCWYVLCLVKCRH